MKSIANYAPAFLRYNNSVLARVSFIFAVQTQIPTNSFMFAEKTQISTNSFMFAVQTQICIKYIPTLCPQLKVSFYVTNLKKEKMCLLCYRFFPFGLVLNKKTPRKLFVNLTCQKYMQKIPYADFKKLT